MNIELMFHTWGISHDIPTMMHLTHHHVGNKEAIMRLNAILVGSYRSDEIPAVLRQYSPELNGLLRKQYADKEVGGCILDYLCQVDNGAEHIIQIIEGESL